MPPAPEGVDQLEYDLFLVLVRHQSGQVSETGYRCTCDEWIDFEGNHPPVAVARHHARVAASTVRMRGL